MKTYASLTMKELNQILSRLNQKSDIRLHNKLKKVADEARRLDTDLEIIGPDEEEALGDADDLDLERYHDPDDAP
jgi:hypothetical protein